MGRRSRSRKSRRTRKRRGGQPAQVSTAIQQGKAAAQFASKGEDALKIALKMCNTIPNFFLKKNCIGKAEKAAAKAQAKLKESAGHIDKASAQLVSVKSRAAAIEANVRQQAAAAQAAAAQGKVAAAAGGKRKKRRSKSKRRRKKSKSRKSKRSKRRSKKRRRKSKRRRSRSRSRSRRRRR